MVDEDVDADGDGFTTCGGDCCDSTECANPALVNPGAFDVPGNGVDDDCDGMVDNTGAAVRPGPDVQLDGRDGLRQGDRPLPDHDDGRQEVGRDRRDAHARRRHRHAEPVEHSIRRTSAPARCRKAARASMLISTRQRGRHRRHEPELPRLRVELREHGTSSGFPADFVAANGGTLPNAPGCPAPSGTDRERSGDADADDPRPDQRELVHAASRTSSAPSSPSGRARRSTTSSSCCSTRRTPARRRTRRTRTSRSTRRRHDA